MAINFSPVGTEVQVNNNGGLDELDSDVAVMTDGRFFVAFERDFGAGNVDIRGQFVNPDGTLSGAIVTIESELGTEINHAVASRPNGAVVVVWDDQDTGGASPVNVQLAIIDAAGNNVTVGLEMDVVAGTGDDGFGTFSADVATFANGTSIIVYEIELGGLNDDIHYRILDVAGAGFISGPQIIDGSVGTQFERPMVAAFGNQALVVIEDEGNDDIVARLYDATSNTVGALQTVATIGNLDNPDVAALTDGRYIVVWDNENTDVVEGRFVDASGNPVGSVFIIADIEVINDDPRVAGLPGGGFVVTWEYTGGFFAADGTDAIVARRFDSTGAPVGDLFLVNTGDPATSQDNPAVAANPTTGQAFIAWEDDHNFSSAGGDNNQPDIRGRAFAATTDLVNGTDSPDFIQTFSLGETINGLGGNDSIFAMAGDDTIDGGTGADDMHGGLGNDTYLVDDLGDVVDETGGDGIDTVLSSVNFSLSDVTHAKAAVENLTLLGLALKGTGNALGNVLTGNALANTLTGGAGKDVLIGGRGKDLLVGGLGADVFDLNAASESKVGAKHDIINQFKHSQGDRIDLSTIDANSQKAGNQKFKFIGGDEFHGIARELRIADGILAGDTNGDGKSNFEILASAALVVADLFL